MCTDAIENTLQIRSKFGEEFMPEYKTSGAAGMDIKACEAGSIEPGKRKLVHTGLYMEIPKGYEGQVRPRSGLALKQGVTVLNSPGTIDSDYRGEVGVILINHGEDTFYFEEGDRIAQIVFSKVEQLHLVSSEKLSETERAEGGFGHSGMK